MKKSILVVNGPNLNLLGKREPGVYGTQSLARISENIRTHAEKKGVQVEIMQSNSEGELIDAIHAAQGKHTGIVINAGAYTHYSYAIRDAITAIKLPCVEVHISNVHAREEFRSVSVIAPVCVGVIAGFGEKSYTLAIDALLGIE
jgi:3-dehydroquinate dehydratase-2